MSKKKIICLSPNKTPPVRSRANRYAWLLASVAAFALNIPAYANPEDGVVSAGSATITTTVKNVDIHQSSNRAIIDWRSFDIAPDETTRFHQPSASATTLNRVNSANPSTVAGNLQANGNVILINPNGVFFSKTAHVDVNGLVATTANIDNSEFMAGSTTFDRPGNPNAAIVNQGRITAREAGLVGLVAPRVENSGTISARLGRVALSSGDTATIDLYGDGLVSVAVSDEVKHQLVRNSGTISAAGGTVQLSAAAGRQIVDSLIDVSGTIDAPTVATRQGRILIQADSSKTGSTALVSGALNAAGRHAGEKGGQIDVLADNAGILSGATLDASGQAGGGTVHVGGDYQGQGALQRAQRSIVQADTLIDVSAGEQGDGGRAIVWADQWTVFAGRILARGGRSGGNGGFVETSGKNTLTATGIVDAAAPFGVAGLWLLDPNNITIQTTGSNTNITGSPSFITSNDSAILTVASIQTALNAGTSVSVTTASAGTNTQLGDITVANSITKSSGGNASLTLTANRSIILNTGVSISSTSGQMGVTLNADSDANGTGSITLNSTSSILSNGGNIVLGGGANPLTTAARGYAGSVTGINLNAATLNAAGGNISLIGQGYAGTTNNYGILMQAGAKVMTSGTGTITMSGTGGVGTTGNRGIYLTGANTAVSSVNGAITLTGQGGGTTTTNEGIYLAAAATIAATGSGAITLTGHAGGTTVQGVYLNQTTAANTLMSAGGTVTLKSNQTIQLSKAHIASPTAQAFNIVLNSDLDGNSSGRIALTTSNLLSSGGNITLGGGSDPTTGSAFGVAGAVEGINLNASTLNAAGGNISLRGTGYAGTTNNYGVLLQAAAKAQTSGSGTVTITGTGGAGTNTNYGVYLTGAGTTASTGDGTLTLTGTARGSGTSNTGIVVGAGATVGASGTGTVSLTGQASTSATSSNRGIYLTGANTAVSSVNGALTITGTGAGTTTSNEGIYLDTGATVASTGSGAITLTGHAGGTTVQGVYLNQTTAANTLMSAGGTVTLKSNQTIQLSKAHIASPTAQAFNIVLNSDLDGNSSGRIALTTSNLLSSGGNITLGGGSDPTTGSAFGVAGAVEGINLNASTLNAAGGNISLRGTGYAGTTNNYGVLLQAAAKAQTSGSGTVTITGTGGAGTNTNYALYLTGAGTAVSSVDGAISLTGTAQGSGTGNTGIVIATAATVGASGTGTVSLTGQASTSATSSSRGIYLTGANTAVSSVTGAITLSGQGGGTTTSNEGIYLDTGATVASTGSGAITLTGHAGGTTVQGVYLNQTTAANTLMSAGGTVTLKSNQTIQLSKAHIASPTAQAFNIVLNSDLDGNSSGRIALTTSNLLSSGGNITLGGGSDPTTGSAFGVAGAVEGINLNASTLNAAGGNISLRGTGYAGTTNNYGVLLQAAAKAQTSGSGTVTITGTGGAGTNTNYALYLTGAGTAVSSVDGAISLTGTAQGSGTGNTGIVIATAATVGASGTGTVSLTGQASTSATSSSRGIYLTGANTAVSSVTGAITLSGQGGGTTTSNEGIYLDTGATVASTGSGAITLTGHAGGTTVQGVYLNQTTAANTLMSAGGTVTLKSNQTVQLVKAHIASPTAQAFNIVLNSDLDGNSSGRIALTTSNLLSSGGNITLGGGSDPTTGNAFGVAGAVEGINLNASTLNAAGGTISLRGQGYAGTTNNYGILMQAAAKAQTSGTGTVTMNATSGAGTNVNYALYLTGAGTAVSSVDGAISLTGTARGSGTSNTGIVVGAGATVGASGTGTVSLTGQASTNATSSNRGIYLTGANTAVSSVNGALTITGTGAGTTTSNEGIYLDTGATVASTGSGAITLTGHAGGTTVQGVYLNQTTAANTIMSAGGTVTLKSNQTIQLSKAHIASPTAQAFNIVLNSDLDGNSSGRIALTTSNLLSSGGNITLGGGSDPTTGNAFGVAGAVEGIKLNASTLNAAGGNISLRGTGYTVAAANNYGIILQAAAKAQTSGSGTVTLTGTGGNGTTDNRGIYLTGAGSTASTVNGALTLTGTGAGTSSGYGIDISSSASVASTGAAPLTLTGIGGTGAVGIYNSTTAATIGGASHTGNTVLTADSATWGSLAIQTTGSVAFRPYTASTTIGVAGGAGTLGITAAILGATTAGSLIIGRSDGSGLMTVNARTWTAPVSLYNGNANISLNGAQVMGARTFLARTYGTGDISIAAASTITSTATGNAIILASGHNFINAGGTSPLTAASGRWLIYSTNPASDTLGGLTSGFRRFSCSYGGSCPSIPASGNGFLYSYTPLLTITPTALSDITYGDATPNLTGYAYTVSSGYLGSDSGADVLTGTLTGATSYAPGSNVGTYNLNYASGSLASALGYGFTYANNASAFTVNKRVLTATLQNQTITYGTATPTLNKASTSDVVWGNLYGSDTGATLGSATFTYGGATPGSGNNAGSYTLGLSGITATNYSLGAVTNSTLTINPYTLTVAANSLSKVVGTPDPVLTYSYGTLQNGDSAAIFTGSLTRAPGDTIAGGPYAITQGTLAINSNYIMNFVAGQLVLTAAIPETVARSTQPQLQFVTVETGGAVLTQLEPARIHVQLEDPALSGQPESSVKPAAGDEDSEEDDCASGATGTGNDTCR